ncbi:MAG: LacI family DNA-binding transcriptional regulator [Clostridiaceae bacterium]|nr:LacI family DNA-binding transcriptional regulator [Clostridiaceae bacterium]
MATLKDVARLACVDVSTVSRALNNTSYVHPETKERIYAAVKQLSYRPNVLAQGLRQGKRHTIGVVVPRLHLTIFAEIVQGIESEARRLGYATMICTTGDDAVVEKQCLGRLRNGFVDGIIVSGTAHSGRLLRDIQSSGMPVVQVVRKQEDGISSVVMDYEACGYNAVKFLAARGCRNIGLISGSMDIMPYRLRYSGYLRALKELELPETSAVSIQRGNTFEYGYRCTEELLDKNTALDAVLAAVDVQGLGVLRALKERGIAVPDQIRVMSLTGHAVGGMLETTMTSQEMPAQEMGEKVVQMLVEEIEAPAEQKPSERHLVFASTLTVREST